MIESILQFLYYILFLLTPLLLYSKTSELFEFNKMLFIYSITALVTFFWIVRMIVYKKIILKRSVFDIAIILFLLSQIASTIFSIDVHTSLFGYYGRFNGGLVSIICYIILYYGFISNKINFKNVLKSSLVSSVLVVLWGLPGKIGHDLTCLAITGKFDNSCWSRDINIFDPAARMFSTLGQPDWLGAFLAINFFIGLYFLLKNKDKIMSWLPLTGYLILNFSSILFTRSRTSLGAILIGLAIFLIYYISFIKVDLKKILLILAFTTILPILFFKTGFESFDKFITISKPMKNTVVQEKKTTLTTEPTLVTDSFDIRKIVWKGALDLGIKYPIFGTGVETFAYSYFFVRPIAHNMTSEWDFLYNKAHNEYLNYLATTGFVGLITYLLLIFNFKFLVFNELIKSKLLKLKTSNKVDELLILCLGISYITILVTNFFGFSTTTQNLFFFLIPAFVLTSYGEKQENKPAVVKSNIYQKSGIFLLLCILVYVFISIGTYFFADINYALGSQYASATVNDYAKAAYYYQEAIKLRYEHVYEDRFSYSLAYLAGIASYQKNTQLAQKYMEASNYYNVKSLKSSPKNVLYWKTTAKNKYLFYLVTMDKNQLLDGIKALDAASLLSPTDPKIGYSSAVFYSLMADIEKNESAKIDLMKKSLAAIDISIKLKPNFTDGINLKAQILKKMTP